MFDDLENIYRIDNIESRFHAKKLSYERTEVYKYDNSILANRVLDFKQYDFSGKFDYIDKNVKLQCLFINNETCKKLYISYNAARKSAFLSEPEYFNRWSYYRIVNACFLGIDDPMYLTYPNLLLGWFYGSKDYCYIDNTIKLINEICATKDIPHSECVFLSSSGGGYAAILGAIAVPNSLSISINPQIYIQNWPYAKQFEEIVGVSLSENDVLLRNNLAMKIKKESQSKHVIIVNIQSAHDYADVIKLVNEFGVKYLRYGLNLVCNNLLIWVYDALPKINGNAHTTFENKQIFKFIEYISCKFKENDEFNLDKFQKLVTIINEVWYEQSRIIRQFSKNS